MKRLDREWEVQLAILAAVMIFFLAGDWIVELFR